MDGLFALIFHLFVANICNLLNSSGLGEVESGHISIAPVPSMFEKC